MRLSISQKCYEGKGGMTTLPFIEIQLIYTVVLVLGIQQI